MSAFCFLVYTSPCYKTAKAQEMKTSRHISKERPSKRERSECIDVVRVVQKRDEESQTVEEMANLVLKLSNANLLKAERT